MGAKKIFSRSLQAVWPGAPNAPDASVTGRRVVYKLELTISTSPRQTNANHDDIGLSDKNYAHEMDKLRREESSLLIVNDDKNEVTNNNENPLHDNEKNIFVSIKYNII